MWIRCQNLTPNPHPNLEPYPYPFQRKTDDINKHKPDQTKLNNSFSGDGAPVKRKNIFFLKHFSETYWCKPGLNFTGKNLWYHPQFNASTEAPDWPESIVRTNLPN